jgi:uncharacterized membrane protein YdjX (TVP38/TMEM64 family)
MADPALALESISTADAQDWLAAIPLWAFLLAFTVLPALGMPMSLFYFAAGAVLPTPAIAVTVAIACMAVNMALSYWVARWLARPLHWLLRRRGRRLPRLSDRAQWRVIVLLRASPMPYLMQSWLLALGGARFLPYMAIGVPVQAAVAAGLVLMGQSLLDGNATWLVLGVVTVLLVQGALGSLRKRLRSDEPAV